MPSLARRLSGGLLLRDLETRATARAEDERANDARRVALASARLDAAMQLAATGSLAEADLLVRAADAALEGPGEGPEGAGPAPDRLSADMSAEARSAFHARLDALTRRVADRARDALAPAAIRKIRRRRIGGLSLLGGVVVLGALALARAPRTLKAEASASWGDAYAAKAAVDGLLRTDWLLPDATPGWIEVRLTRPRKVSRVRLLNARNLPYADRSTHEFRIEAFLGPKLVKSMDGAFPEFQAKPTWKTYAVDETVDRFRVEVRTWRLSGGGLGEIEVD